MKTILIFACLITWVLAQNDNDGSIDPKCGQPQAIEISDACIERILERYNHYRKAGDMPIIYDRGLAKLGETEAMKCEHNFQNASEYENIEENATECDAILQDVDEYIKAIDIDTVDRVGCGAAFFKDGESNRRMFSSICRYDANISYQI